MINENTLKESLNYLAQSENHAVEILNKAEHVHMWWNEAEDNYISDVNELIDVSIQYNFSLENLNKHKELFFGIRSTVSHDRTDFDTNDDIVGGGFLVNS